MHTASYLDITHHIHTLQTSKDQQQQTTFEALPASSTMETVNKVVDAGYKAIWGENENTASAHGDEPVSGVMGLGTPTDPYDAGNRDGKVTSPMTLPQSGELTVGFLEQQTNPMLHRHSRVAFPHRLQELRRQLQEQLQPVPSAPTLIP